MVNSKKMNKSSVAIILLSLLLVLSLILTATGAWFTDKKSGSNDTGLKFGTVSIEFAEGAKFGTVATGKGYLDGTDIMPGDTVEVNFEIDNKGEAVYYLVKVDIEFSKDGTALEDAAGAKSVWYYWDADQSKLVEANNSNKMTGALAQLGATGNADKVTINDDLVLTGATYDNQYQGYTVIVNVEVRAIQQANVTAGEDAYTKLTAGTFYAADDWAGKA